MKRWLTYVSAVFLCVGGGAVMSFVMIISTGDHRRGGRDHLPSATEVDWIQAICLLGGLAVGLRWAYSMWKHDRSGGGS